MKEQLSFLFSAVGVFLLLPCVLTFLYREENPVVSVEK